MNSVAHKYVLLSVLFFLKVHVSICKSSLYLSTCVLFSVRVITFACVLVLYIWLFVYAQCPGLGYVHMQDVEAESHVCVFVCVCVKHCCRVPASLTSCLEPSASTHGSNLAT